VVSGSFAIDMAPHERGPNLTHTFRPGAWIGASALLKRRPRHATVLTTRPSSCLYLSGRDFSALAARNPQAWRWLGVLGILTLVVAVCAVDDFTIRQPDQRIVAILLRLAGVRQADNSLDPQSELDLTQHPLAYLASFSKASVAEYMDRLAAGGLIARAYGKIRLVDTAGLRLLLQAS